MAEQVSLADLEAEARRRGLMPSGGSEEIPYEDLLAEAKRRGLNVQAAEEKPGLLSRMGAAWRGDAAEDLPNVNRAGMGSFRSGVASMFGSDEDYANSLAQQGYQITQDENGNPVAVDPKTGQRAYVNQPGMDFEDVTRIGGKVLSFLPAARLTRGIAGLGGRTVASAGTAAATDAGMQAAASAAGGDVEIDPAQTAAAAGGAAVGEMGGAALQRMHQAWKARGAVADIRKVAQEMGLNLSDDQARVIAREFAQGGGSMDNAIAANEFGVQRTVGQRSGDWKQLRQEEFLRQSEGGAPLRELEARNRSAIESVVRPMIGSGTADDAAMRAGESLRGQADDLMGRVDDAYGKVGELKVARGSADELPNRFNRALRDSRILPGDDLNATNRALQLVRDNIAKMDETGTTAFSLKAIDNTRKQLRGLYGRVANAEDRKALTVLAKEYDAWVDDAVETALVNGDDAALAQLKEARGLRAEYGRKFQDPKEISRVVEMYEDLAPREIAAHLGGMDTLFGKANAARVVKAYKATGADVQPLREAFAMRMLTGKGGDILGNQALKNNLREATRGRGESVFKELFTPQEIDAMGRLSNVIDDILPKGDFARSSGSAERVMRNAGAWAERLPFPIGDIMKRMTGLSQFAGAQRALSAGPAIGPSALPAAAATIQTTRPE